MPKGRPLPNNGLGLLRGAQAAAAAGAIPRRRQQMLSNPEFERGMSDAVARRAARHRAVAQGVAAVESSRARTLRLAEEKRARKAAKRKREAGVLDESEPSA